MTPGQTRPRGRPRSVPRSGIEPREEILQTAASLFSSKGIGATRITDIAAAIGVAAPSIYYHFDNMDVIVATLLRFVVEESAAFATHEVRRKGRCTDRLRSLIVQHVDRLASGPYDLWFVVGLTETDAIRFPSIAHSAQQWRRAVQRLIEDGIAADEFREIEPELALALVSGIVYGALQLRHKRGAIDPDAVAEFVIRSLARPPKAE